MNEHKYFNILNIALKDSFYKLNTVLDNYKTYENIWNNLDAATKEIKIDNIDKEKYDIEIEWNKLKDRKITIVLKEEDDYPLNLKEICWAPLGLYIEGSLACLKTDVPLSVIGSRKATNYGELVTEKLISGLKNYNICIIGGLALGIDSFGHREALKNNLKTIAVIGSGLNHIYPREHNNLAKQIIENGGAIISEHSIETTPKKHYFVARNRIISGMSKGVLIIEAQKKSGTAITAKFALEQDRDVMVVPNNIFVVTSEGTNELLREGARPVLSSEDVLDELGIDRKINEEKIETMTSESQKNILSLFEKFNEIDVDLIIENLNMEISEILSDLTILELNGILRENNNKYLKI